LLVPCCRAAVAALRGRLMITFLKRRTGEFWRQVAALVVSLTAGIQAIRSLRNSIGDTWAQVLYVVLIGGIILGFVMAWLDERKNAPVVRSGVDRLTKYNAAWLRRSGRAVVITRDMSWVINEDVKKELLKKSERGELTLVVAKL